MGRRLFQLNQIKEGLKKEDYLLIDGVGYLESKKVALGDIDIENFNNTENYLKKDQAEGSFVKKEEDKGLSSNDFSNEYKQKLDNAQEKLISGVNIKSINGESVLGEGDIIIKASEENTKEVYIGLNEPEDTNILLWVDESEEGASENIGTVDQTYDPKSQNAQSGIAVAEAIAEIPAPSSILYETEVDGTVHQPEVRVGVMEGVPFVHLLDNATSENLRVYGVENPRYDIDAANKAYVDDVVATKVNLPTDPEGNIQNGTSGQVLQTNGDGTTEWVDMSGDTSVDNITPEQTTFFDAIPSGNLLDISTKQIGMLHINGRIYTGGSYDNYRYFEQYIPVKPSETITVQYTNSSGIRKWSKTDINVFARVVAYDSTKNVLPSLGLEDSSGESAREYIVPENVAFVRLTFSKDFCERYSDIAVLKDVKSIIPYEEYGSFSYTLKAEYLPKEEAVENTVLAFLPDEICCAVGRTIEIYNNQVCPLAEKYHFQWDCTVGKAMKRKFSITGVEDLIGEYPLSLRIYDDAFNPVYIASTTLKIVNPTTNSFSICTIGDSLTNAKYWLNEVRNLSSNAISFVGTRGAYENLKHEGRSGFRSTSYLEATSYNFENEGIHPFWDATNNKFSWEYYKTTTGINPDVVQIFLGTNDLAGSGTAETLTANIKTMVDDIRSNDANIPIFIVLTICWGNQNGIGNQTSNDGFASQKGRYKYFLDYKTVLGVKTLYETLKDYTSLFFVPLTQCHDSEYNFGGVETPVNPRASQTELIPNEAVHPQQQGYEQMADVMYSVYSAHIT